MGRDDEYITDGFIDTLYRLGLLSRAEYLFSHFSLIDEAINRMNERKDGI